MHVLIDGTVERQLSVCVLIETIEDLVELIGMTPIDEPKIDWDDGGLSAYQLIKESHIAMHYIGKEIRSDVFSCKDFDPAAVYHFIKERFIVTEVTRYEIILRDFDGHIPIETKDNID